MRYLLHFVLISLGFYFLLEAAAALVGLGLFSLFLMGLGARDLWRWHRGRPKRERDQKRLAEWKTQLEEKLADGRERYPELLDHDTNGIPYL